MHFNRNLHEKVSTDGSAVSMTAEDSSLLITAPFREEVTYKLCAGKKIKSMVGFFIEMRKPCQIY